MRKHVAPADPAATIPDPSRSRPLPPEGLPVTWGPYWAGLAARAEIVVSEISEKTVPEAAVSTDAPAEAPTPKGTKPTA